MGIFRRRSGPGEEPVELSLMLLQGQDMIARLAEAHASWGLGTARQWGLDQRTGVITWTFADKTATAAAQILGSYNPTARSWLWAWANDSILPALSVASETVRDWAVRHGQEALARPKVEADDERADTFSALAVRITRATGFYRGSGGASLPIITFGPVTLTDVDGHTSTFKIEVE
ncbi:DUF6882 domain-containing protein [Dactylosporangium sp. CA-052675]|uniref:DUF6882 domain-containing protein n=1 Tax=Dactylosporangium sp. CA-052675 TaxID=3239927 RepID=UPI003D8C024F